MKKPVSKIIEILLLLISISLFLIFIFNKSRSGIILFGDMWFSILKKGDLLRNFYLWSNINFGSALPFPPSIYELCFRLLTYILPLYTVNHLYYYGTYLLLGLSTVYLVKKINPEANIFDYLICTSIAVISPLVYPVAIIGGIEEIYSLAFVNFAIGFLLNFRTRNKRNWKNLFIFMVILLFLNVYLQTYMLFVALLLFYLTVFHFKFVLRNPHFKIKTILLFIGLNFFWLILPVYNFLAGSSLSGFINYDVAKEGIANLIDISRDNQNFYPFTFYNNLPMVDLYYGGLYVVIVQLCLFCFAIIFNFIFPPKEEKILDRKIKLFALSLIIIFYIFSMGLKGRWQDIFQFFWNYMPFFNTYRSIFKFLFPIYFSFLILLIYGLARIKKFIILKLMILIFLLPTLTVFTGEATKIRTKEFPIPQSYKELENYLAKKPENYTKIVPDQSWYSIFKWRKNGFDSVNILPYYVSGNVLYNFASQALVLFKARLNDTANELLLAKDTSAFGAIDPEKFIDVLGIETVIVQKDTELRQSELYTLNKPKTLSFLKLKKSLPDFEIYKNVSPYLVPMIYPAENAVNSSEDITRYQLIISDPLIATRSAVIFLSQQPGHISPVKKLKKKLSVPSVKFLNISPTNYSVRIDNPSGPFILIFNQTYHWGWQLKGVKADHFQVNGYANAWLINPEENANSLRLTLSYLPQNIFFIGAMVTLFFIGIWLYLIIFKHDTNF